MRLNFQRTVARELTLWLSIITTVTALVLGGAYSYYAAHSVTSQLLADAGRTADEMSQVLVLPLFNFDQSTAERIANIYLQSGRVKGISIQAEGMGEVYNNHQISSSSLPLFSRKIVKDGAQLGTLELVFNDDLVTEAKNRAIKTTLITVLLLLLFYVLSLSFILRHILITPLTSLGERLQKLADGSFTGRLDPLPQEDLNTIVLSANKMLEEIASQTRILRENEKNYREIYNATSDAIFIHKTDGTLLDVNQTMLEMYGYTKEEIHSLAPGELHGESPYSEREAKVMIRRALEEGPQVFKWLAKRKDGSGFWVEVALKTAILREQTVVLALVRDISQRELLEEQLRQSQRMEAIGTLAGGIAHDFNNILSAILGYTELSLLKLDKSSKLFKNLKQVERASIRARELVRQILTFSRKQNPKQEVLPLASVLSEAMTLLRSSIPVTVNIVQNFESHSLVEVDVSQIHQVIMNLCTNAFQAMPDSSGTLTISLKDQVVPDKGTPPEVVLSPGDYVVVEIHDDGLGMEETVQKKIFAPYFTTRESEQGTGLGLALVRGIVKDHHGQISVSSTPGTGTVFRVFFPVTSKPMSQGTSLQGETQHAGGQQSIVVVDDEESIRNMMKDILLSSGYRVEVFADGLSAWQAMSTDLNDLDLLITDLTMPGLSGVELAGKVREERPEFPVILCTGYNEVFSNCSPDEKQVVSACLQKPLTIQELLSTVAGVLQK